MLEEDLDQVALDQVVLETTELGPEVLAQAAKAQVRGPENNNSTEPAEQLTSHQLKNRTTSCHFLLVSFTMSGCLVFWTINIVDVFGLKQQDKAYTHAPLFHFLITSRV